MDAFDDKGRPRHLHGVAEVPGLYFVGLPWLSCRGSAFIWGAWKDAERLAEVKGISEATATNLKIVQAAAQRFARDRVSRDMPILGSWQALIDYVRERLAHYKCPTVLVFADSLPRNASGKLLKRELRISHGQA